MLMVGASVWTSWWLWSLVVVALFAVVLYSVRGRTPIGVPLLSVLKPGEEPIGEVDRSSARVSPKGFQFVPFAVPAKGVRLRDVGLDADEELLLYEHEGARRLFAVRELAYHHIAQGELAGQPYMVSF